MGATREYIKRLDALEEAKDEFAAREADYAASKTSSKLTDEERTKVRDELGKLLDLVEKRLKDAEPFFNSLSPGSKAAHEYVQKWQERFMSDNRKFLDKI